MATAKRILALGIALCLMIGTACAEFDVTQYSYEELLQIQEAVKTRMEELDRQYALEHADRRISFETEETVLYLGETIRMLPVIDRLTDDAPAMTNLIWTTSDEKVASVTPAGTVKAVSGGDAVITAAAADNPYLSASYTVHAAVAVESILIWGQDEPLVLGNNEQLAMTVLGFTVEPEDAYSQNVIWQSSDESIATIDENRVVKGIAPGTATITATSTDESATGKKPVNSNFEIRVIQGVTALIPEEEEIILSMGEKRQMAVRIEPEDAGNRQLTFRSENEEIATVDKNGMISTVSPGECGIICETTDGTGIAVRCTVHVNRTVTGLTLSESGISMAVGETKMVEAIISPDDATKKDVIWTSSNVFVARVNGGMIEAVGQGNCEITCTTTDGSNLSAAVQVRVPTFSVGAEEYIVTEKSGLLIPVLLNQKGIWLTVESEGTCFGAALNAANEIQIEPIEAGEGTIRIENPDAKEDSVTLRITVADSAVFNENSYPPIPYMEIMKAPERYEGAQIGLLGKVIAVTGQDGDETVFAIGTEGKNYTDQVFQVRCGKELIPDGFDTGCMVTVYGIFGMEKMYSEGLQAETVIPAVSAERIILR